MAYLLRAAPSLGLLAGCAAAFAPPSAGGPPPAATRRAASSVPPRPPPSSSSTSLYAADGGGGGGGLPFFAAPAFSNPAASGQGASAAGGSSSSSGTPQSATVTLRLPLGTLFDGRDYVFVTESNVRGYEWTTKETDILLDDLMDAALGNLGGKHEMTEDDDKSAPKPPPAIVTDYELSQIVLVPTSDWDPSLLGLGARYDVYDGQQRLVTLNLLLAALRDAFREEAADLAGGKRAVALAATAHEISGMLVPTKVRKEDVMRITLRRRDNVILERILVGDDEGGDEGASGGDGVEGGGGGAAVPTREYSKMSTKDRTALLSSLSPANGRIFQNFAHLSSRLALLTTREKLRLLDYIVERVYLLVCIPETSRIARNIVMSQGRKGMDNEPVDDFKGLVCFRYTLEESQMYETFDRWDALAAEPSATTAAVNDPPSDADQDASSEAGSSIKSVGRDTISSACLLRASASLRTKIRSRGGDEVYEWERWLRQELWTQNQRLASSAPAGGGQGGAESSPDLAQQQQQQQQPWQGKDFFASEIAPSSIALYKYRAGLWDEFDFLSKSKQTKSMTKKQRDSVLARLDFLRDITSGVTSAKEAEIIVLELLLRLEKDCSEGDGDVQTRYLDEILPLIEKWTLWMALTRPSPMQRHAHVFSLLNALDDLDSVGSSLGDEDLGASLRESMNETEFGATAGGKRLAAAMLKRMNAHLMIEEKKNIPNRIDGVAVDLIQPNLPSDQEEEDWTNRIGNLALVSTPSRGNKKVDPSWESKCKKYKKEPWVLTRQLSELGEWDLAAAQDQQKELLSLMDIVWSLD